MPPELTPLQLQRLAERAAPLQSDFARVELPPLPAVPGMISAAESRYLYWLTARGYTGAGAVIEVGTWLGKSTLHLAAGLRDAGLGGPLHCFDQFKWADGYSKKSGLDLAPGDDFQPYFERNVRPVFPDLVVTRSAMQELVWERGPVEILFLDAPKRLPDISATLAAFAPSLVPGLTLIVFQDYLHFPSYALAAVVSQLDAELELVHVVLGGATVAFAVRAPLDCQRAQPIGWNFQRWTAARAIETWRRVLEPLAPGPRAQLEPGLAMLLHDLGARDEAVAVLARMRPDRSMQERWQRLFATSLYDRYRPLFHAVGLVREPRPERGRLRRVLGRALGRR